MSDTASPDIDAMLGLPAPSGAPPASTPVPSEAGGDNGVPTIKVTNTATGELAMGAYEAADRFDKAVSMWGPSMRSADGDILPDKHDLDAKSRDMLRNDAYVQGGQTLRKDNIVGSHFMPNSRPATRKLFGKDDEVWEEEFQEEVEELFDLYAESTENWIDASRTNSLTGLVRLAVGIDVAAGEVLSTVEWDAGRAGEFATMIQMIDLDRLCTDPASLMDENVRGGVRSDRRGAPIAYQIRTNHPGDIRYRYGVPEWKEVPIRKPWGRLQVIHLHEQMRPDQTRGVSEMATALKPMRIGHRLRDLNLQRVAAQALYAAAITSEMPTDALFQSLGGQTTEEAVESAVTRYATGYLGAIDKYAGSARNLHLDGVKIPHLYPGTKLELLSPNANDKISGGEFEQSLLRNIAASIGVSYEQLSRDYTSTNYSSARAAMSETWKYMQARKKLIADRYASIIWRLWLEEAINNNHLSSFPSRKAGMLYTNGRLNLNFEAISRVDWIGASRGQIDELKETQAAVLRVQNGLSTLEDELARLGKDWRKVFRQLKREQARREALGLVFTPSKTSIVAGGNEDNDRADAEERQEAS